MDRYSFEPVNSLSADDAERPRNDVRDSLFLAASLDVAGRITDQVRVRNLSAGGMMAEFSAHVDLGAKVKVDLRGIGIVTGRIAWATDGRIGIAFDDHIDPMRARKPVGAKPLARR